MKQSNKTKKTNKRAAEYKYESNFVMEPMKWNMVLKKCMQNFNLITHSLLQKTLKSSIAFNEKHTA